LRRASLQRRKLLRLKSENGCSSSLWQTVNTGGGGGANRGPGRESELLLPGQARAWYARFSRQAPTTKPAGKVCRRTSGPQLNPVFLTWLMGWPQSVPCEGSCLETEFARFKQRMRLCLSGLCSVSECDE
jgi:hypothetical protein